ncbi:protein FAM207A [Anoplophora glabripennis]|uniref:protein FAM207A n=1 Tax=Anoplophora glabripennis TaxID=217634 RepID=UPI00087417C9|nr:protein FAM207A [Anoplophora glabripennis]
MEINNTIYRKTATGKLKRQRKKLHIPAKSQKFPENQASPKGDTVPLLPISPPKEDLFAGLNIDINNIKKSLVSDDVQSIKSNKSSKSESGKQILPKKEKIKLRRELLLKKIDTVNQMKKELKIRERRKNTAVIGDTNPLHDALPSLESLLKNKSSINYNNTKTIKKRGIEKATQRKKKLVEGVKIFKQTLKNKDFKKNPLEAISIHVKAMVEQELKNKC